MQNAGLQPSTGYEKGLGNAPSSVGHQVGMTSNTLFGGRLGKWAMRKHAHTAVKESQQVKALT